MNQITINIKLLQQTILYISLSSSDYMSHNRQRALSLKCQIVMGSGKILCIRRKMFSEK